ncbi:hypothetical protein F993_03821 [Acinetobacter proteolyticus]|uniref:Lipoprotein n=1 Tax=Acinetobacter proteolyticus TaxID=1776741 RepID=A0ABN0J9R0_9GAMM|nr:hypothetical protein [Acinetobacter proteolyticus]ENU21892.1 hypothetical protein F993_03821 [Acinetobacter proteolyticus]
MNYSAILLFSIALVGCSHANDISQKERENEISDVLKSRTTAISDDISQSRRLYVTAYNTIDNKSEINNELFIYTIRKVDSLIGNYEMDHDSFKNDISVNKYISLEAIDGLCIMNKFVKKYTGIIDLKKTPQSIQEDTEKSLEFQPLYIKRLNEDKDHLNQLKCLTLK